MPAKRTSGHFCSRVRGPRNSPVPGAGRAGSGCQALAPAPAPCARPAPLAACQGFKGVCEASGGPGGTALPETERREQKEAVGGWFGGRRGGTKGRKGRPQREGCGVQDRVQAALEVPGVAPYKEAPEAGEGQA